MTLNLFRTLIPFIFAVIFLNLTACANDSKSSTSNETRVPLPPGLQKLSLGNNGGVLNAYVTIDDDTANRIAMLIDPAGEGSALVSIPGLSRAPHRILISYEYTIGGITYLLATANRDIDLSNGDISLTIDTSEYEINIHDDDTDGVSNAAELKAGTDPGIANIFPIVTLSINTLTPLTEASAITNITASLSQASGLDVTVNLAYSGSAIAGTDYSKTDSITIPAGSTLAQVTLTTIQDKIAETTETIIVDIGDVINGLEVDAQQVTTSIADDDTAPVFSSGITASIAENTTATGYIAAATDADGDTPTFSLSGGNDQAAFIIDAGTGVLSFKQATDFENPRDSDTNNTYNVEITATDGFNPVTQALAVSITDVIPQITANSAGVKSIQFDWSTIQAANYKLLVNPDNASGFTVLQDNITEVKTTILLPVHLSDWVNASYLIEAYNDAGQLVESSAPISITSLMISSIGYFKASNTGVGDRFGSISLSADGDTLAIGASSEGSSATGINGNQLDNSALRAGAIYVFNRTAAGWQQQAYIKASNTGVDDFFGSSISLSADGTTLAIGALNEDSNATGINGNQLDNNANRAGAVYVFSRTNTTWQQQAYIKASNTDTFDNFGGSVSLSTDGNTLAVGATGESSNATGINGNQLDNSANTAGAAYVFSRANIRLKP